MKLVTKICLLTLLLAFTPRVSAKAWRGIIPLQSTRSDVVRLFSECEHSEGGCVFTFKNEDVYLVFSSGAMSEYHECARQLPADTVLLVEVKPKAKRRLSQLKIDMSAFRTFDPSSPPNIGYKGYLDEKDGLIIKTYKGRVLQVDYIAAEKDVYRCASYYEAPESFVQLLIDMYTPPIDISCPTNKSIAGEKMVFSAATVAIGRPTYKWRISAGRIVAGQGTLRITVDTTGLGGQTILATIERHDHKRPVTQASCQAQISLGPDN